MLGLGSGICSSHYSGEWSPLDEGSSLVAWYKKGAKVTAAVSNKVTLWENQEGTAAYNMAQSTETNQPTFNTSTGAINFDGIDNFLQMTGQITLPTTFTVGIRFNAGATGVTLLADNTIGNEMFKIMDSDTIRVKALKDSESPTTALANLNLGEGAFDADSYVVITRDGSGNMGFWHKGVDQSTSATLSVAYDIDIDAIGARQSGSPNYFKGDIFDVSIFNTTSSTITGQLNTYLSGL